MITNDITELNEDIQAKLTHWFGDSVKVVHAEEDGSWEYPEMSGCVQRKDTLYFVRVFPMGGEMELSVDREVAIGELA